MGGHSDLWWSAMTVKGGGGGGYSALLNMVFTTKIVNMLRYIVYFCIILRHHVCLVWLNLFKRICMAL